MAGESDLDFGVTVRSFAPGVRVFGRYVLVRPLGRGGMGVVWLARDEELAEEIALKFLPEAIGHDLGAVADLKMETRRCRKLTHPHIVRVHGFEQDARSVAISMEFIDGGALSSLRTQRPGRIFDIDDIRVWVAQICAALEHAHRDVGVVHRDLKPANILLDGRGRAKIADFGISTSVTDAVTRVSRVRETSYTPSYASPQQMAGQKAAFTDDIYSLGATIYELLTGKPPFHTGDIHYQVREVVPCSMTDRRREFDQPVGDIPAAWEETIAACLAKQPEDRPKTAGEVAARLQGKSVAVSLDPVGDAPTVVLWIKKKEPEHLPSSPQAESAPPPSPVKARRPRVPRRPARSEPDNRVEEPERSERKEDTPVNAPEKPVSSPAPVVAKPAAQPPVRKHRYVGLVVIAAVVIGAYVFWRRVPERPSEPRREITGPATPGGDGAVSAVPPGAPVIGRNTPGAPPLGSWTSKSGPVVGQPWENTLGMRFVPVPGTEVLFCVWETRVQDYEAFSQATKRGWTKSGEGVHPAVNVSWDDAQAFCRWLTERERAAGRLAPSQEYRLPRDWEWSVAVELSESRSGSPQSKDGKIDGVFPWGTQWPPPREAGNYDSSLNVESFAGTSPVGSFAPNRFGIHDLGGNVLEWVEDDYGGSGKYCAVRGAAFDFRSRDMLLSSNRETSAPDGRGSRVGFRVVCAAGGASLSAAVETLSGPAVGQPWSVSESGLEMVWIKPGRFAMGSEKGNSDEKPVTQVTLTQGYWLGKYEVTQGEWQALMGGNPSEFSTVGARAPVEQVSWDDAMVFCRKLTERERTAGRLPANLAYTLPTEAQWEYACRAGTTGDYAGGLDAMGWYDQNSGRTTHPVGQKQANAWGLHDMHGNVWEWCADWYADKLPGGSVTDPNGAASGSDRVVRGGGWDAAASNCRSAVRSRLVPGDRYYFLGFRLALASSR